MRTCAVLSLMLFLAACGGDKTEVTTGDSSTTGGATTPQESPESPSDTPPDTPPETGGDEKAKARAIVDRILGSTDIPAMIPQMVEQIGASMKEQLADITDEELGAYKNHVRATLESDFEKFMKDMMVDFFTLEELTAMSENRMIPELEEKMPKWLAHTRERGREWGLEVGAEAMEKALEGD
jgi:hypothetical protein